MEIENIFLPITERITLEMLQKHQNLDPVIGKMKSWHKCKTKPLKAETTILGNKTLLDISENLTTPLSTKIQIS